MQITSISRNYLRQEMKSIARSAIMKNAEEKYYDTSIIGPVVTPSGTVVDITVPVTGLNSDQSVGSRIFLKSLWIKYTVSMDPNAGSSIDISPNFNIIRIIVFQWRLSTTPVVSDIIPILPPHSFLLQDYNFIKRSNYHILYDKRHDLGAWNFIIGNNPAIDRRVHPQEHVERFLEVPMKNIDLDSPTHVINDKGHCYVLYINGDNPSLFQTTPGLIFNSRMLYTDS